MIVGYQGKQGISKLKQMSRKIPVMKTEENGDIYLMGFKRKLRSRKSHQEQMYKNPLKIKEGIKKELDSDQTDTILTNN